MVSALRHQHWICPFAHSHLNYCICNATIMTIPVQYVITKSLLEMHTNSSDESTHINSNTKIMCTYTDAAPNILAKAHVNINYFVVYFVL